MISGDVNLPDSCGCVCVCRWVLTAFVIHPSAPWEFLCRSRLANTTSRGERGEVGHIFIWGVKGHVLLAALATTWGVEGAPVLRILQPHKVNCPGSISRLWNRLCHYVFPYQSWRKQWWKQVLWGEAWSSHTNTEWRLGTRPPHSAQQLSSCGFQ